MKKYVLHVCGYAAPYPGNFIASLTALAVDNKKMGYDTIFVFPYTAQNKEWCQNLEKEYIVYYLPLEKARIKWITYKKLREIYKKYNITIAHSHFELYDMPVSLMAPKSTKVFWHLHDDLGLIYKKSNAIYKLLWKIQYAWTSKNAVLLSVSEKGRRFAVRLGFNEENTYFLPNSIDIKRLEYKNYENEECVQNYDFLIYGWDYLRKGVDILEEAIPQIESLNFTCGIVANEEVWKQIRSNNHLIYQPPVNNVTSLYRNIKCFLHISRQEGLSYALLEAIYSGVIIICSDIEQNLFAQKFPTVFLVPVEDSMALANKMKAIITGALYITDDDVIKSKEMVRNEYSIESWVKKIQNFYFGSGS